MTEDRTQSPSYGVAERVTPRIRRVLARNPGPFTAEGTATFLIGEGRDLAIVDPGPANEEHLDALLRAIGDRRVACILVTHTHRDHSPLAHRLAGRVGAPVLAFGPHGAGRRPIAPMLAPLMPEDDFEAGADHDFRPDIAIGEGVRIRGDGWTVRALHTPGHAANHLCFALEEEGVLFTGDHVMGWSTSVIAPPDGDMGAYLRSLERLLTRTQDRLYLPTHGPAIRDPREHVRQLIRHRRLREATIRELLHRLGEASIAEIVPRIYPDIDPRLHPAAAASTLAHLIALVEAGEVAASDAAHAPTAVSGDDGFPAWAHRRFRCVVPRTPSRAPRAGARPSEPPDRGESGRAPPGSRFFGLVPYIKR